jgi:adenosyl cobinamide kinase/adenosyl cobinamide phosphate guanylyltransferase
VLVLVLGGARSGKSAAAERIALTLPQPVTYVATLTSDGADADVDRRIAAHRARRPTSWRTVDASRDLAAQLSSLSGTVLLDSLGPWIALNSPADECTDALTAALGERAGDTVVVSDEVGLSVHPTTAAGLAFRDCVGGINQALATVADHVLFVVAGRVLQTTALDIDRLLGGR